VLSVFLTYNKTVYGRAINMFLLCALLLPASTIWLLVANSRPVHIIWASVLCGGVVSLLLAAYERMLYHITPFEDMTWEGVFVGMEVFRLDYPKAGFAAASASSGLTRALLLLWLAFKLLFQVVWWFIAFAIILLSHVFAGLVGMRGSPAKQAARSFTGFFNPVFGFVDRLLGVGGEEPGQWSWRRARKPFYINPLTEANPHINISGSSGYGKSTLCRAILSDIVHNLGKPVLVLDVHNEFSSHITDVGGMVLSARDVTLNVWELDGVSPRDRISFNLGVFKRIFGLGGVQTHLLGLAASRSYARFGLLPEDEATWERTPPTTHNIIEECKVMIHESKSVDRRSLMSLIFRLNSLTHTGVFSAETTIPFREVVSQPTSFALADLRNSESQALFIDVFLRKLYDYMVGAGMGGGVRLFVLIDEAHRVCAARGGEMSYAGVIASEARKYGIGLITSNQMMRDLDKAVIGNSAVTFAFYQKEPEEQSYVAKLLSGGSEGGRMLRVREALRSLDVFQCIAITSKRRDPVLIEVKPPWKRKACGVNNLGWSRPKLREVDGLRGLTVADRLLAVLSYDGVFRVSELRERLRVSGDSLAGALRPLAGDGKVEVSHYREFNGVGIEWVGVANPSKSLEHRVYVCLLSEFLKSRGVSSAVLDKASAPDLEVEVGGRLVALEYETGRKSRDEPIIKMLKSRFRRYAAVVVVTPPEQVQRYNHICRSLNARVIGTDQVTENLVLLCKHAGRRTHRD